MSRMDERAVARGLTGRDDVEPPAGLLEEIQAEIPAELRVSPELAKTLGESAKPAGLPPRQRWLIAAGLIAMLGAGVVGWEMREWAPRLGARNEEEAVPEEAPAPQAVVGKAAPRAETRQAPAAPEGAPTPPRAVPSMQAPEPKPEEARKEAPSSPPLTPGGAAPRMEAENEAEQLPVEESDSQGVDEVILEKPVRSRAAAPEAAAPPPPPPPPSAAPRRDADRMEARQEVAAAAPEPLYDKAAGERGAVRGGGAAQAGPFLETTAEPVTTFDLTTGIGSYDAVRRALAAGRMPDPATVRVEEIVDTFGTEEDSITEGAPTPFTPGGRHRMVLFNVGGRTSGARAEVEWNPQGVERYRRISTALYEIELRPGATGRLATLRWRSPGEERTSEATLTAQQIARSWEAASPALRLSAMAAELAETLAGPSQAQSARLDALLREARSVAAQLPGDARAKELVDLVSRAAAIASGRARR